MNTESIIALVALSISTFATSIIVMFKIGRVFEKINDLVKKFDSLDQKVDRIDQRLCKVENKVVVLETKMEMVFLQSAYTISNSPMQLNEAGQNVLEESGVTYIVEASYRDLIETVRAQNPQNAYQAQEALIHAMSDLKNRDSLRNTLETGAYASGTNVDAILFVGAIYIRDRVLEALGFTAAEIDAHKPKP